MESLIGPASKHGDVRVFGEMVTVLCSEGKSAAAMRLEELWTPFVNRQKLHLLCAYPLAAMYGEGSDQIQPVVCQVHLPMRIQQPGVFSLAFSQDCLTPWLGIALVP
jgi:hypothetical protein